MLTTRQNRLFDNDNRLVTFKGIALGGNSKFPFSPPLPTNESRNLYSTQNISFAGRPFPLKEADEHLRRIQYLGFNLIRLIVPWEALTPHEPFLYDQVYINYLVELLKKMQGYNFKVIISAHQEAWSRFTGGSGAPLWTFELAGFAPRQFHEAGAAFMHQHTLQYDSRLWATNYNKLAAATMFTLFWAGKDFAPLLKVESKDIQTYLQEAYIKAYAFLWQQIQAMPHVLGIELMNEPSQGWVGYTDIRHLQYEYCLGATPTPLEAMAAGAGHTRDVANYRFNRWGVPQLKGKIELNHKGIKVWQNGVKCIWKQHGVWDIDSKNQLVALKPHYFAEKAGKPIDFAQDYYKPFLLNWKEQVHQLNTDKWTLLHATREKTFPTLTASESQNTIFAFTWQDEVTIRRQQFSTWQHYSLPDKQMLWGSKQIVQNFANQITKIQKEVNTKMPSLPALCIKTGVPFNINAQKAYKTQDFSLVNKALQNLVEAFEQVQTSYVLWNYTANNRNDYGDGWNLEDYSIFSLSQKGKHKDLYTGIRAIETTARPYIPFLAGNLVKFEFLPNKHLLTIVFEHFDQVYAPTQIFLPELYFQSQTQIQVSDGKYAFNPFLQTLIYHHTIQQFRHTLTIQG